MAGEVTTVKVKGPVNTLYYSQYTILQYTILQYTILQYIILQ